MSQAASVCFRVGAAAAPFVLAGCDGVQSALDPAGVEAERVADLWWWMAAGAAVIWVWVMALAVWAVRARPERRTPLRDRLLIVGAGTVVPVVVLTILLVYGLAMLPPMVARATDSPVQVEVVGEQWWWRVRYVLPGGGSVVLANEIRLPVGERVQFTLAAGDVVHSFWIPSIGGKIDMIPGRITHLALQPTRAGVFRGACAEYCGASHALMNFYVEVMERDAFERWLADQAAPAAPPRGAAAERGEAVFFATGCTACHRVNGTAAAGLVGPDLTHVGSRLSLGAGILPNEPAAFVRWIAATEQVKPAVHMPSFGMLPQEDLQALAAYLEGLQ